MEGHYIRSDVDSTGIRSSERLLSAGLNPLTADMVCSPTGVITNGPWDFSSKERGRGSPIWSASRLLVILPNTDSFSWQLQRCDNNLFNLTVYCNEKSAVFTGKELIDVLVDVVCYTLEKGQMAREYTREGFEELMSRGVYPSAFSSPRVTVDKELFFGKGLFSEGVLRAAGEVGIGDTAPSTTMGGEMARKKPFELLSAHKDLVDSIEMYAKSLPGLAEIYKDIYGKD